MATTTNKFYSARILYGFDPRAIHLDNNYELSSPAAEEHHDRITIVYNHIHNVLQQINYQQSTLHFEKARQFNIPNWVLIDRRNLLVKAGNNKSLTHKWLGLYKVIKANATYASRLDIPESTRWHNIVHTTLLKTFRRGEEPSDMDKHEKEIWANLDIFNSRSVQELIQY